MSSDEESISGEEATSEEEEVEQQVVIKKKRKSKKKVRRHQFVRPLAFVLVLRPLGRLVLLLDILPLLSELSNAEGSNKLRVERSKESGREELWVHDNLAPPSPIWIFDPAGGIGNSYFILTAIFFALGIMLAGFV